MATKEVKQDSGKKEVPPPIDVADDMEGDFEESQIVTVLLENIKEIETNEQVNQIVGDWLNSPENADFARKHEYTGQFDYNDNEENDGNYNIEAQFKVKESGAPDPKQEDVSKQADYGRGGGDLNDRYRGTDYQPMRSTAYTTGGPPRGQDQTASASQGLWMSYYAQQREREVATNQDAYRKDYMRDTHYGAREPYGQRGSDQYRGSRVNSGSPLRQTSNSPPRYEKQQQREQEREKVVTYTQSFSLYEQHREQREQREHIEYTKIQNEHQKSFEISQLSAGIRDRIISTYRSEIESHKHSERDFISLQAQIEELRKRKEALDISCTTLQGDYEAQLGSQQNVVASLNHELEILRTQNSDKQREGVEVSEQTQAVRIEITTEDKNCRDLQHDIQTCGSHNQSLEREIDKTKMGISAEQELRQRQQSQIYQSNGALSKWEQECYAQSTRISVLDNERRTLVDRTNQLNEQLNSRTKSIEETSIRIHQAQTDITKLKSMIHGLDLEINNLERANGMLVEDQKQKLAQNSQEYNTAHELTSKLQGLEAQYYSLEVDERGKNTDLEAVNYSNQALMDRNLDLKSEYEALQKHSSLLTQQNRDLQRELDSFVETDDVVRRNLDRKEKVDEIRYKVDAAISTSVAHVYKSKSPIRTEVHNKSPSYSQFAQHQTQANRASQFQVNQGRGQFGTSQKSQTRVGEGIYGGQRVVSASYSKGDFSPAGKQATQYTYKPARGGSPLRRSNSPKRY